MLELFGDFFFKSALLKLYVFVHSHHARFNEISILLKRSKKARNPTQCVINCPVYPLHCWFTRPTISVCPIDSTPDHPDSQWSGHKYREYIVAWFLMYFKHFEHTLSPPPTASPLSPSHSFPPLPPSFAYFATK